MYYANRGVSLGGEGAKTEGEMGMHRHRRFAWMRQGGINGRALELSVVYTKPQKLCLTSNEEASRARVSTMNPIKIAHSPHMSGSVMKMSETCPVPTVYSF